MTDIRTDYETRYNEVLVPLADRLEAYLHEQMQAVPRVDRISARAKSVDRFMAKATKEVNGTRKYEDPLNQIQDQVGARIVTFYLSEVDRVASNVKEYSRAIEDKYSVPESDKEFDWLCRKLSHAS